LRAKEREGHERKSRKHPGEPDRQPLRDDAGPARATIEGAGAAPDEVRTYRQLWQNGQRLAQALLKQGLQPGDHFALLMANHAEFVDAMVAASICGTVFVPIDPRTKGDKLAFMLENGRCKGVIAPTIALDN